MRIAFIVILLAVMASTQTVNSSGGSPSDIVAQYCQRHEAGMGLSSRTYAKIQELVDWPDEPGWDTVVVVSGFHVLGQKIVGKKASVDVEYKILGVLAGDDWYPVNPPTLAQFELQPMTHYALEHTSAGWKITGPLSYPKIGLNVAIRHIGDWVVKSQHGGPPRPNLEKALVALKALAINKEH